MGYKVTMVERFKNLPIIKVQFETSEDVRRILEQKEIRIGFNWSSCEPFNKYHSRPRSHFIQCRKCFGLNHFARDCSRRERCKYCGLRNHKSNECFRKRKPKTHRCILCKGSHASDSILCPVIQKTREAIGINPSMREKVILKKKQGLGLEYNKNNSQSKQKIENASPRTRSYNQRNKS